MATLIPTRRPAAYADRMNRRRWLIVLAVLHLPVLYGLSLWPVEYARGYVAVGVIRGSRPHRISAVVIDAYLKPSDLMCEHCSCLPDSVTESLGSAMWSGFFDAREVESRQHR